MTNLSNAKLAVRFESSKKLHKGRTLRDFSSTQAIPLVSFPGGEEQPFVLMISSKPDSWRRVPGSFPDFDEAFSHVGGLEDNGYRVRVLERISPEKD